MARDMKANWYASRADGKDRSHIPAQPFWSLLVRIAQAVLAVLLVVLTAFSASRLGSGVPGFGMTWFSFSWTAVYFGYLAVSVLVAPEAYHYITHLVLEALSCIFWLATWATLAGEASDLSGATYYHGVPKYISSGALPSFFDNNLSTLRSAIDCVGASAGIGALVWLLFCVTLAFLVMSVIRMRKSGTAPLFSSGSAGSRIPRRPVGSGPAEMAQA